MNAVELQEVSYLYGSVRAVEDVSLTVAAGEVVAMLGPNGAGKSTTLLMLLGLLPPATGTVRLFGGAPTAACAAGRVGAMPQAGGLLPRCTVSDLLRFLHDVYPDPMPIAEALATADLTDLAGRTVEKLSGGQAQRLRFAMALVGRPDLLVLDEPTAALDVEARHEFWAAIRRYAGQGRTVLFSTHYLEEADANADRIVVLDRGRVIADGTAASVKRRVSVRTVSVVSQSFDYSVLPGVVTVAEQSGRAVLTSTDSDATVLALAEAGLLRDLEVAGAGLEEAYLALTRVEA
ncbi:ABC transporter ATP-binding protein [Dactylosporangium sp. NPDC051541]|uniref:ABC transporter ATP-binding protein n=1 Tax=Dactylosporangium sp. NPDC051541 TaxID=3363977 RepID=UPI0037AC8211